MSGSAAEFVMATYIDDVNENVFANTKFDNLLDTDEYDIYSLNTFILGDATKEISLSDGSWYNNHALFIDSINNWFIRGGIGLVDDNGIFYYNATRDVNNEYISTRVVIR